MSTNTRAAAGCSMSLLGARIHPTRSPPEKLFDNEPIEMTTSLSNRAMGGGIGADPGNGRSRKASSINRWVRVLRARLTTDSLDAESIRDPLVVEVEDHVGEPRSDPTKHRGRQAEIPRKSSGAP